jgi:hypothetical protein
LIERSVAVKRGFENVEDIVVDRSPKGSNEIQTKHTEERDTGNEVAMRSVRYLSCPAKGRELLKSLKRRS